MQPTPQPSRQPAAPLSPSRRHRTARIRLACAVLLAIITQPLHTAQSPTTPPIPIEQIGSPEPGWPQFRGPFRNGISSETGLLRAWPGDGPSSSGQITGLGRGFSSPILSSDHLFITGDIGDDLILQAFRIAGDRLEPAWRATNGLAWNGPYPGSRSSVTLDARRLHHLNAHGRLACLDAGTGAEIWTVDVLKTWRGENITWGLSECPVVDERAVYITAGGRDALVVALDKVTGRLLWQSDPLPDPREPGRIESASYVSPVLVRFAGRTLLVGCSLRQLYCIDGATGRIEWTRPRPTNHSVLAMMPAVVGDGIFMTAPHGPPGSLYRFLPARGREPGTRFEVDEAWTTRLDTCQGGVVAVGDRLYGSFYPGRKGWAAVDATSGAILFEEPDFTKGAVLHADDRLYALCEDGWMLLLEPTATRFEVRGRFRLAGVTDRDAWAHPVIHEGRLYLRYHDRLEWFDVRR